MSDFGPQPFTVHADPASPIYGQQVTFGSTLNQFGANASLIDPIPMGVSGFYLAAGDGSFGSQAVALRLSVEPTGGGTAQTLVPFLPVRLSSSRTRGIASVYVPLALPAGARLSCAGASDASGTSGHTVRVRVRLVRTGLVAPHPVRGGAQTLGAVTTASGGTLITAGIADVAGAWTVLGTTDRVIRHLTLIAGVRGTTDSRIALEVGAGPMGTEVVIARGAALYLRTSECTESNVAAEIPVHLPANVRLVVRSTSSVASQGCNAVLLAYS